MPRADVLTVFAIGIGETVIERFSLLAVIDVLFRRFANPHIKKGTTYIEARIAIGRKPLSGSMPVFGLGAVAMYQNMMARKTDRKRNPIPWFFFQFHSIRRLSADFSI